jgi:phage-related minor tail protein
MPALKTTMAKLKAQVASLCEDIRSVERVVVEKEIEAEAHAHRLWIAQHHKNIQAVKQWSEDLKRQARQQKTHQLEEQAQQEREIQRLHLEKIVEDDLNRYNNRSNNVSTILPTL